MAKKGARKGTKKARRSAGRKSYRRSKASKTYTLRGADIAAGIAMAKAFNLDQVMARGYALYQKQTTAREAAAGALSDIASGSKDNIGTLVFVPLALTTYRKVMGRGKTVKVPGLPLRLGA